MTKRTEAVKGHPGIFRDHITSEYGFVVGIPGTNGQRRQVRRRGFRTIRDAQAERDKLRASVADATFVEPDKLTTGAWLVEWLDSRRASIRPRTHERYVALVTTHAVPAIGGIPLQKLTATDLDRLYAGMLTGGRQRGAGGLSPRSVRFLHTVLRKALADAQRKGKVLRNVADLADPPAHSACRPPEMATWSPAELAAFLASTAYHEHGALFRTAAMTGLRRGELGGLRWRDLDLDAGMLTVRRALVKAGKQWTFAPPKTKAGERTIDLDAGTVAALRRQRLAVLERCVALGPGWQEHDLVFPALAGGPAALDGWGKCFRRAVTAAGLPVLRFHDLRHTHASHLLGAVDVRTVAARLGHADPGMTLRVYSHVMPGRQAAAVAAVAALVDGHAGLSSPGTRATLWLRHLPDTSNPHAVVVLRGRPLGVA